ncbi:hypothetical protein ACEV9Z_21695 [Vibrio parahaemolyticus]|nr:hypothetical protein [Vibrio alginolyticus]
MGWLSFLSTGIRVAGAVVSALGGTTRNANGELMFTAVDEIKETYLGGVKIVREGNSVDLINSDPDRAWFLTFTSTDNQGGGKILSMFVDAAKSDTEPCIKPVGSQLLESLSGAACYSAAPVIDKDKKNIQLSFSIKDWSNNKLSLFNNNFGIRLEYERNYFILENNYSKDDDIDFTDISIQAITNNGDVYNLVPEKKVLSAANTLYIDYPEQMDSVTPLSRVTVTLNAPWKALEADTPT